MIVCLTGKFQSAFHYGWFLFLASGGGKSTNNFFKSMDLFLSNSSLEISKLLAKHWFLHKQVAHKKIIM